MIKEHFAPLFGLLIPRSSVRFRQNPENSNSHGFELHRPSIKGTELRLKVIKAIIIICSKNRVDVVRLICFEKTINWNAHCTTDWSIKSATNGVVDGGVFMNMLPKDHAHVVQCHSIYMSYKIP